jgi:hypothetical protein
MKRANTSPPPARGRRLSGTRAAQQRALDAYAILDTPRSAEYDDLAQCVPRVIAACPR